MAQEGDFYRLPGNHFIRVRDEETVDIYTTADGQPDGKRDLSCVSLSPAQFAEAAAFVASQHRKVTARNGEEREASEQKRAEATADDDGMSQVGASRPKKKATSKERSAKAAAGVAIARGKKTGGSTQRAKAPVKAATPAGKARKR